MMRRENKISLLIAAVLAFCISFGGAACIATGFELCKTSGAAANYYTVPVNLWSIALFCGAFSVVAAVFFSFRRGGWILLGILALLLGYLWRTEALETSLEAILYRLSFTYNRAYRWGIVSWTDAYSPNISPNLGLSVLVGLSVLLTAWTVCHRKNAAMAVFYGAVLLGTCFVVTDTAPDSWCLFLFLIGMILLILTNTVRRQHAGDGNRLTALLLVPSLLFTSVLFWAIPRDRFEPSSNSMQQMIMDWLKQFSLIPSYSGTSAGSVDLAAVGPKAELLFAVMDVNAPESGMLYLRGQAMDIYSGKAWSLSEAGSERDGGWPDLGVQRVGTVTVSTRRGLPFLYFPYYPAGEYWPGNRSVKNGGVANPYRQREYSFTQMKITGKTGALLSADLREQCLSLPQSTRAKAAAHLSRIGNLTGQSERAIAAMIEAYVSGIARYDLDTERMPGDEDDFAMWFLNEAESGYCIHYATAATVLLRAAGVPARYVSGYAVRAEANTTVVVTENKAHAWVEYFVPDTGWLVLDPTPASWYPDGEEPTEPPVTTEPETDATEPSTSPTQQPTEPQTQPTEPLPEVTTQPGGEIGGGEEPVKIDLSWLWEVLKWLGLLLGIYAVIAGQYFARLGFRRKQMHTGHPNHRALARWRMVVRLSKLIKEEPPEDLYELAEKAKFSQHTLTAGERMAFDLYLRHANEELNQKPWLKRWLIRLIWAV